MRLIKGDELLKVPNVRKVCEYDEGGDFVTYLAVPVEAIENAPAVDAVEVVRCKDCVYWRRVDKDIGKCPFLIGEHQYALDNHYCSCGEREEKNAAD